MSVSLVSIHHPVDANAIIPFIGSKGPLDQIAIPAWQAKSIKEQGFVVDVHEEHHDVAAARHSRAVKLANALQSIKPVVTELSETIKEEVLEQPSKDVIEEVVQESALKSVKEETIAVSDKPVVKDEVIEQPPEEPKETVNETPIPQSSETASETTEEHVLSEEELANLRSRVENVKTLAEATDIVSEFGFELDPTVTRLKDIKAAMLAIIDGE
jgi:hypothetical protein